MSDKPREFGVIIDDYGLALPTGNTKPTHTVIEKSAYDELLKANERLLATNLHWKAQADKLAEALIKVHTDLSEFEYQYVRGKKWSFKDCMDFILDAVVEIDKAMSAVRELEDGVVGEPITED